MSHTDHLDPLDIEGVLALRPVSERHAERIGNSARILWSQNQAPSPRNDQHQALRKPGGEVQGESCSLVSVSGFLSEHRMSPYSECRAVPLRYNTENAFVLHSER